MYQFWDSIIKPLLNSLQPGHILEIGCDLGDNTRQLLEYCAKHHAILHAVDPAPGFDPEVLNEQYGEAFIFYKTLSLNAIDRIEKLDAVLIDGDHNWYTVYNELKMIERCCERLGYQFPLILLHDVGWPYARRDLYYKPEDIPEAFRKPYQKKGMQPGRADLLEEGGLNDYLCNAIHENTYQNGILTAAEDFLRETPLEIKFQSQPGLHGLGILVPQWLWDKNQKLVDFLNDIKLNPSLQDFIERLESERINEQIKKIEVKQAKLKLEYALRRRDAEIKTGNQALAKAQQTIERIQFEKKAYQASNKKHEGEISRLTQLVEHQGKQLKNLIQIFEHMSRTADDLLNSTRWKLGHAAGEMLRKLKINSRPVMAPDIIGNINRDYQEWGKEHQQGIAPAGLNNTQDVQQSHLKLVNVQGAPVASEASLHSVYIGNSELYYRFRKRAQEKKVSIIMPTYNHRHLIGPAIESVLQQYYQNFELIIVDDGSTDGTRELIESTYQGEKIKYHYIENHGAAYARNCGLEHASGHYIAYLDSDNEWYPEYLAVMVNMLEDRPELDIAYCAQEIYDKGELVDIRFHIFNRSLLMNKNYIDINSVIHKRSLYDQSGGFDADLPRLEDWDLALRYTAANYPLCINAPLVKYHKSDHYKNPLKDARLKEARDRYAYSIHRIQSKMQTRPLALKSLTGVRPFVQPLFSFDPIPEADLKEVRVSIIIPSYETLGCLKVCIEAIQTYTKPSNYELIIIDNASSDPVVDYLRSLENSVEQCQVVCNTKNMGFTYAVNQGISAASVQNDVLILNNDAIVTEGWLEAFTTAKRDIPDAGIIAPQQVLPADTDTMQTHVPYCTPDREIDVTVSVHHKNLFKPYPINWGKGYKILDWATFFCAYITRPCLDAHGLLDHKTGRHFKSDKTFCARVNKDPRYQIIYTPWAKVYHLLQQATKQLKKKDPSQYRVIFEKNNWEDVDPPEMDKDFKTEKSPE